MGLRIDIRGMQVGKLKVIGLAPLRSKSGECRWQCLCDCGKVVTKKGTWLRNTLSMDCGCSKLEAKIVAWQDVQCG